MLVGVGTGKQKCNYFKQKEVWARTFSWLISFFVTARCPLLCVRRSRGNADFGFRAPPLSSVSCININPSGLNNNVLR